MLKLTSNVTLTLTCWITIFHLQSKILSIKINYINFFLPIINLPTNVTLHSCTLIDDKFCNRVDEVESSGVITKNISDHYPVFAREKFPTLPEDSILINHRQFRRSLK